MSDDQKKPAPDVVHRVAVIGATGQMGFPVSKSLLALGHFVLAISRSPETNPKVAELISLGATASQLLDFQDSATLSSILKSNNVDTVVVLIQGNSPIIKDVEPRILAAAVDSGTVKRFVPNEFGTHTLGIEVGQCVLFDAKKAFQKQVFESGLGWTLIFAGGFFDYFLPNFRLWEKITTFGDVNAKFPTHDVQDIARVAARIVTDPRTLNKAVQICHNVVTQAECIEMLRTSWPDHPFEVMHLSAEFITEQKDHGPDIVSAKGGVETDRERHGINYVNFVLGRMMDLKNELTLNADDLYPDEHYRTPKEAFASKEFVFG